MTREEAIAYFERHIDLYCVTGICREAEEMAIAALKQQPCGDLINKADTLKAMSNTWSHICSVARRKKPTKGEEAVYSDMVGTVKNLPPVNSQPCDAAISRQWLMECVNEGWIKFDTEKDENRFIHLIRDIAPPVTLQPKTGHWIEERTYMSCPHCHDIWHYEKNQTERFKCCPTCGERIE